MMVRLVLLFVFMRHAHMLAKAVFVLELFVTTVALLWCLVRVLRSHVSPKIYRRYDQFTDLTLGPFVRTYNI